MQALSERFTPAARRSAPGLVSNGALDAGGPVVVYPRIGAPSIESDVSAMITGAQMKAARALLGMEQRTLAELSGLSLQTIQRMEASDGNVRGNVDSLVKVVATLNAAGVELLAEGVVSHGGGRGVRLKQ